jgi:hypothetical protein
LKTSHAWKCSSWCRTRHLRESSALGDGAEEWLIVTGTKKLLPLESLLPAGLSHGTEISLELVNKRTLKDRLSEWSSDRAPVQQV